MIPIYLKRAQVTSLPYPTKNKKDETKPYHKCRVLAEGADEFLELGVSSLTALTLGTFDMKIIKRVYDRGTVSMHFFDLVEAVPAK